MCIVYKMVTTLEKNNAASIAKVTTLSSSTQGSVYSYHLSSANSGQIISNYNRITSRGSKGVEDERNKIKVSSLPPESEEKYEIKVNGSIKETLRGRNHDELTRKLEYETRKEISSIVASLKPDTGNEERFFEGPHEQKYVWMFKQYRSQKLQDRRIIHPKISKLMDLSFNRFGNYWVIEDLRAIKMLEDNLKLYREQQKSEDPLDIEYNYIFMSPDKEWMIDLNKCVMNSIKFDREDPKFIESKAQGIIKHKGEMVETCRIHLKRAEDFNDMGEEEDPYGNIREYLRFLDSKESQAEIAKVIMELLSDDTQVCIEENKENEVFSIKNLKKNARTLWPELKHGRYFLRFLSESDQEGILNGSLNSLKSNNQLLILSVGMMFFLEELINPTRSLKRDKYSQKIRSIFEVDKFWDYSLTKTIEAIIPSQGEATEVFNSVGKFANIFKDKEMVPLRLQNTFLMLMFKSMELYYEKESLIKPVIVIPPWGETLEDLKDIIDPSELMVKISRCHVYDLGPSKSPWGVKNKDIPFLTESLENQSFGDALLCDFITIIGNNLLSNTGVPNPPLCVYPRYYFYMKN